MIKYKCSDIVVRSSKPRPQVILRDLFISWSVYMLTCWFAVVRDVQHRHMEDRTGDATLRDHECQHVIRQWSCVEIHRSITDLHFW